MEFDAVNSNLPAKIAEYGTDSRKISCDYCIDTGLFLWVVFMNGENDMYDKELAKRMLNFLILDVLKEYSDEDHHLTQQEILRLLKLNYDVECDRRSVKSNVEALRAFGYDIDMENGYCLLDRTFEESELRMLIDSVLFSKNISQSVAQSLISRLKAQGSRYFRAKVPHIYSLPEMRYADNTQVMYNLDVLNTAIAEKKKVSFIYNSYGTDFKLYPKRKERYIASPYQLVANNGWYYLIANYDKYEDISHYRIDKITKIEIIQEKSKPASMIKEMENGFSLPRHMAEHIYMYSGDSISVKLMVDIEIMNELVDWFGKDFRILEKYDKTMKILVKCNEDAMRYWALQYGPHVEVLEPKYLREWVREAVSSMAEKYKNE